MATMSSHDPAFLWETEALRQRRGRRPQLAIPLSPGWVTLRQAHESTGVPIDTLRKWGRQGSVPSMVVESEDGLRRLVRLENVVERAESQGRDVPPMAASPPPATPERPAQTEPGADAAPTSPPQERGSAERDAPPGTMIVPIEAWDKMLMQLGNLHDAGQQLAEARERAARAETEATFLRERLAEQRANLETEHHDLSDATEPSPSADAPAAASPSAAAEVEPVLEYALRRWRLRRRRSL